MKGVLRLLLVLMVFSILLVGCEKSEREQLINDGISAYTSGDVDRAFSLLKNAQALKAFSEDEVQAESVFGEAGNTLWTGFRNTAASKEKDMDFEGALEAYQKADAIASMDEVTDKIPEISIKIKQQKAFNEYVEFYNKIITESNTLLRAYSTTTDSFAVDNNLNNFNASIKETIPKSNDIVSRIDEIINSVGENLTPIHQEVISLVNYQHNMFLNSLLLTDNTGVQNLKAQYLTVKKTQTELTQKLKDYATEQGILFSLDTKK